jgi:hypothetical protein
MARIGKFFFFDGSENLATVFYYHVRSNGGVVESIGCVDNTSSFLEQSSFLLSPSGYKEDTVYTQKPIGATGNLTFTRGSDAWRTNVQGLVERTPYNLLSQSETFDNSSWTKASLTVAANTISAPNGTLTADTLIEDTSNSVHRIFNNVAVSVSTSIASTYSVYLKSAGRTRAWVRDNDLLGALFNLSTGTIVSTDSGVTASITNVGDSWYRCTITKVSSSVSGRIVVYLDNGTSDTYIGNGTNALYIWGAQLVEGAYPLEYFPTTDRLDVPRIDYSYGTCPALLLEPQRTNIALQSEGFDTASWQLDGVTISANQIASPIGITTADLMTSNGTGQQRIFQTYTVVSGSQYTISVYVKQGTTSNIQIVMPYVGAGPTFTFSTATFNTVAGWTSTVQTLANGWYRISVTQTATSTQAGFQLVLPSNGSSVYLWGAQFEQGAYPSSYIRTEATTVTRLADSFSRNNIYTNNLITSAGGTWYVELRNNIGYTRDANVPPLFISDVSGGDAGANMFGIGNVGFVSSLLYIYKRIGGVYTQLSATTTSTVKIAIKWNGSTADVFVNGIKTVSATTFTTTQMQFLNCNGGDVPKYIQGMALYPVPLDDVDCELLTNPTSSGYSSFASMASSLGYILI